MIPAALRLSITAIALMLAMTGMEAAAQNDADAPRVRTEIYVGDSVVTLASEAAQEKTGNLYTARDNVSIAYKDILITGGEIEYNDETFEGVISGGARFSQGEQWFSCSAAEFNFATQTGAFYDVTGYTDKEFQISGRALIKTGPDTFRIEDGSATTCRDRVPKWSFSAARAEIRVDHTARMRNAVFRIKGIPVLYTPYLILPTGKKERSSGFVPFNTGTSTTKGRMFSEGYYQTLGRSADLLVHGDYFSLRGLAMGGVFRARPNADSRLELRLYGINDSRDQGGLRIAAEGETLLKDDWRAVVHANIYSNFAFRQAFAEDLESATVPTEKALGFLTRNHKSISFNIAFGRDVVLFPETPLITKKTPSLEITSLGTPLGRSPFILDFRAALEGLSRSDSLINTGSLTQRLDFFPRVTMRLPSFAGFSIMPTVGMRETYYGARIAPDAPSGVLHEGFERRYFDLSVDVKAPVLERDFHSLRFGDFRHSIEPGFTYRRIYGIRNPDEIIRFDHEDAIADTNEIEYGIVNRFTKNGAAEGRREFMSFGIMQKHYFDPTFGGAFMEGRANAFYPLYSLTGFYQTGRLSNVSPTSLIFQLSPQSGIYNDVRADFDVKQQRWRNVSLSTLWEQGDFFLTGTYFILRPDEPGQLTGNHVQGQIGYGAPDRGFSAALAASYNLSAGQWLNSKTRLSYAWDCCSLATEVNQYDLGLRTESRVSVSFTLKGIGNFGNVRGRRLQY
jgi:LPS-assembly protein